jgi:hypothetical protein
MKKIILSILITACAFSAKSQSKGSTYQTAVGLKLYPGAVTLKHFIKDDRALEGLAYFWDYGVRFTGLYEFHGDIPGAEGLKWYAGPGAHIGFWSSSWKDKYPDRQGGVAIGVDGVVGLDYKFSQVPINVSVDWQPSFNFVGYNYFEAGWGGVAVRYTF